MKQKYNAMARIAWEFESDLDHQKAIEQIHQDILVLVESLFPKKVTVRLEKKKKTTNLVLGEFDPDCVLPFVTISEKRKEYRVGDKIYHVRMNSHRYFVFKTSRKCVACGIEGTKMLLEQHPFDKSPHFNFYAEDGNKLILMTKDHIHARSNGGEDRLSNYQTLCCVCNNIKGSDPMTLDDVRHLRGIYNQYKTKLTRKKLNARIRVERDKLIFYEKNSNESGAKCFVAKCDLLILQKSDRQLEAMSAYEAIQMNFKPIACVKKGSTLQPISIKGKRLCIQFNNTSYILFLGYVDCP